MHTLSKLLWAVGLPWALAACASQAEVEAPFVKVGESGFDRPFGFTSFGVSEFVDSDQDGLADARLPELRSTSAGGSDESSLQSARFRSAAASDDADFVDVEGASSAGAFFSDGVDGDVRARTENFFQRPAQSPMPEEAPSYYAPREAGEPSLVASRKMIRAGQLGLEVPRVDDTLTWLQERAEALGGFMAQRSGPRIVLRVPAAVFTAFVDEVKKKGRVLHEDVSAQDVTEDYQDVKLRLENLQSARKRLVALLDKAEAIKDVLSIEKELTRMTEEIERLTGRLKFLDDRITLATLTVQLAGRADQAEPKRRQSRFPWIRMVGVEHVWNAF